MYKLFILAALFAVAAARPGHLSASPLVYSAPAYIQEPAYANVGSIVKSIPTAVSHQSISQVHSSGHYVQPIVAPVVKTSYDVPAYSSYTAPAYSHYAAEAPVYQTYASAPLYKSYAAAPVVHAYNAGPVLKSYAPTYGSTYSQW